MPEAVEIYRYARLYFDSLTNAPSDKTIYKTDDGERYYYDVRIDGLAHDETRSFLKSAQSMFDVNLVSLIKENGVWKRRVYVEDEGQVPEGAKPQRGPQGGIWYESSEVEGVPDREGFEDGVPERVPATDEDEFADGWSGPPEDLSVLDEGDIVEVTDGDDYFLGEVEGTDDGLTVTTEDGDTVEVGEDVAVSAAIDAALADDEGDGDGEIEFTEASPEEYAESVEAFIDDNPEMGAFLTEHSPEELEDHTLITTEGGGAGVSVSSEGDIQNLFNHDGPKGSGRALLEEAIEQGGITLDCYDGYLRDLYAEYGFREVGRMEFDPDYAPEGWNFEEYGQPDVVFMSYQPEQEDTEAEDYYEPDEWGQAKADSRREADTRSGGREKGPGVGRRARRVDSRPGAASRRAVIERSDVDAEWTDRGILINGDLYVPADETEKDTVTSSTPGVHSARYSPEDDDEEARLKSGTPIDRVSEAPDGAVVHAVVDDDGDVAGLFYSEDSRTEKAVGDDEWSAQIDVFRVLADPEEADQYDGDVLGVGVDFPESDVYVDWRREAFPDALENPHVSEYGSIEDLEKATGNIVENIEKRLAKADPMVNGHQLDPATGEGVCESTGETIEADTMDDLSNDCPHCGEALSIFGKDWTGPFRGERGGRFWYNPEIDERRYQDEPPDEETAEDEEPDGAQEEEPETPEEEPEDDDERVEWFSEDFFADEYNATVERGLIPGGRYEYRGGIVSIEDSFTDEGIRYYTMDGDDDTLAEIDGVVTRVNEASRVDRGAVEYIQWSDDADMEDGWYRISEDYEAGEGESIFVEFEDVNGTVHDVDAVAVEKEGLIDRKHIPTEIDAVEPSMDAPWEKYDREYPDDLELPEEIDTTALDGFDDDQAEALRRGFSRAVDLGLASRVSAITELDEKGTLGRYVPESEEVSINPEQMDQELIDSLSEDFTVGESVEDLAVHEMFHAKHVEHLIDEGWEIDEIKDELLRPDLSERENEIVEKNVSRYGASNPLEVVAEVGLAITMGKEVPEEALILYEKYGGPDL